MIQSQDNTVVYVVSEGLDYIFPFKFFRKEDLSVFLDNKELTRDIDWVVDDRQDYTSGAVVNLKLTAATAGAKGKKLVIQRIIPVTQDVSLPTNGKINSLSIENAFDKLTMIAQQIQERTDRSLLMPPGEDGKDLQEVLGIINTAEKSAGVAATAAEEAATAAEEVAKRAMGLAIGTVFPFPASTPPEGAYLLNGQTIVNCAALYPKFWEWVTTAGVRSIDSETYEAELASTGVCGGFVVDTSAESVRLPTVVNGTLWGADSASIGQSLAAGLPNVTGSADVWVYGMTPPSNGALIATAESGSNGLYGTGNVAKGKVSLDASSANPIYGNSDTVQPPAIRVSWCIQVYNAATALSEQHSAQLASKMQTYLPLAGGTMTGNIRFSKGHTFRTTDDYYNGLFGGTEWNTGGHVIAYGKDSTENQGGVNICAHNGSEYAYLAIRPNGLTTVKGKDITLGYPNYAAAVSSGNGTSYTAVDDGWVLAYTEDSSTKTKFYVNSVFVGIYHGGNDSDSIFVPVKKGDKVTATSSVKFHYYPNR